MKIPFDIKFRPQIESGEYKVVTTKEQSVRIICWDRSNTYWKIVALVLAPDGETENPFTYDVNGNESDGCFHNHDLDLFIIIPEPELSEFEERIFKLLRQYKECDIPLTPENIKAEASMLWSDFEKYFFNLYGKEGEGDSALRSFYYRGLADGKAEALKNLPRWKKAVGSCCVGHSIMFDEHGFYIASITKPGCLYITFDGLAKFPGFNED